MSKSSFDIYIFLDYGYLHKNQIHTDLQLVKQMSLDIDNLIPDITVHCDKNRW